MPSKTAKQARVGYTPEQVEYAGAILMVAAYYRGEVGVRTPSGTHYRITRQGRRHAQEWIKIHPLVAERIKVSVLGLDKN